MESKKTAENVNTPKEAIFIRLSRPLYTSLIPRNRKIAAEKRWVIELNGSEKPFMGIMDCIGILFTHGKIYPHHSSPMI